MPCISDYYEPSREVQIKQNLVDLLEEVGEVAQVKTITKTLNVSVEDQIDLLTEALCNFCKSHDVTDFSLELQIWWRDHLKFDRLRMKLEQERLQLEREKQAALAKLTDREREILEL